MTQKSIWNIDWNEAMTHWSESTVDFIDLFGLSLNFVDFYGHSAQVPWFELANDSSSISETWIDSTHDSSGFPGIDSKSTHDSRGFPRYWFRLTQTRSTSPFFDSNQLMTQAKSIWFWFWDSTLGHTHVCLQPARNAHIWAVDGTT